ncbi:MAG: hypothetical protein ACOYJ6_10600 [Caulobacterales bacterium]|jgi:hypothetical protein
MSRADLEDNLAYVREVAEAGRNAPFIGGIDLAVFGALTAAAFAGHWAIGVLGASPALYPFMWMGYGALMGLAGGYTTKRAKRLPGAGAIGNRVDAVVWNGVTFAILAMALGILGRAFLSGDPKMVNWILPAAFSLYGVALFTTGRMADQKLLTAAAFLAFLSAAITALLVDHKDVYLVGASLVALVMAAPGVVMLAREPKPIG